MKHSTSLPKPLRILLPITFWIGLWWILALSIHQVILLPTPWQVLCSFGTLCSTLLFWKSVLYSLLRILVGLLSGVVLGTLFAVLTVRFTLIDTILSPMIRIIRSVPVASFILLVLLWSTNSHVPSIISCLMVMPVLWQNVRTGILNTDPLLLEMTGAYKMNLGRKLRYLWLPSVKPTFAAGLSTSIGLAWKSGIAAEVLCIPKVAIGTQIYFTKLYLETPELFAWTLMVILLSMILEFLIKRAITGKKVRLL